MLKLTVYKYDMVILIFGCVPVPYFEWDLFILDIK